MGQYAIYIWGSYGFSVLVLGGLSWHSVRCLIRTRAQISALDIEEASQNLTPENVKEK